ncbi:peptidoglycan-binding protein [Priestia megaterium]|uniref:peptidoglycan-binding protein n=1 Tax=Priestia megaterium TaxID=1404 RepID=UPI001D6CD33E|nr:peptidoglycan-binding protein [Priestia megaterium]CAH0305470.1 Peptidoglycan L-alanyl-D-glutamate endopeptidase CwlK [Priestia megaterium]
MELNELLAKAEDRLSKIHPTLADKARQLIAKAHEEGIDLVVTQGLRTIAEQNALYAQGRTAPGKIVTKAKGGSSYHNFGLAFDIAVRKENGEIDWDSTKLYSRVGQLGKSIGLEWGGDFKSIRDTPHFQLTFGLTLSQLRAGKRPSGSTVTSDEAAVVELGAKGELITDTQAKLTSLGFNCGTVDGIAGAKTIEAIKAFQKANGLDVDGIAGTKTLAKLAELIDAKAKAVEVKPAEPAKVEPAKVEDAKPMPKVTSLGDKYSVQVKAKVATGVYKNADISEKTKTLKAGTVFSVYGYTPAAWAVPGGFVQMKDVEPVAVTLKTGGLNPSMEAEFRTFLKSIGLEGALNLAKGGNPSATITASGLDLVKVRKFLDEKGWYYK